MAITLKPSSFKIKAPGEPLASPQLPPHGGDVNASFSVSMSNKKRKLKAVVGIFPDSYVLAGGASEQEAIFDCRGESGNFATYRMGVEIRRSGTETVETLKMSLEVRELSSKLLPVKGSSPLTAGTTIRIRRSTDDERASLAETLVDLRTSRGKTQAEAAAYSGLSVSTISRAERGLSVSDESLATIMAKLKELQG